MVPRTRRTSLNPLKRLSRKAFTIVEIMISVAIFAMVIILVYAFYVGGATSTSKSVDHSDAIRSAVIACEAIRRDLARALYQEPTRDLGIFNNGRGVSVRIPSEPLDENNLWQALHSPVTYTLKDIPGSKGAKYLIRKDDKEGGGSERQLKGCYLRDILVQYIPQGKISPLQAYLEVTMIGMGNPKNDVTYTTSMLIPMPLMLPTGQYSLALSPPGGAGGAGGGSTSGNPTGTSGSGT